MYITVSKANLVKTLSHLYRIVEKKSNIPLLSNVKIEAGDNLKFTAINTDLEIIEIIEGNINERGDITVPVHVMHDIVRKLPEDKDIEIKTTSDASNVIIKAGNSEFTLPALPTTDFPVMTTTTMPYKFKLTTSDLIKLIDKTQFAVSTEETRYFLNGIFFETLDKDGKKMLRAVATDGHRLAKQDVLCPAGAEDMQKIIIPRKVIAELRNQLNDTSDDISIETSETKARFSFGNTTITSNLVDGKFPDYAKVIPVDNNKEMEVDCKLFSEAVDRVSSVSYEKSKAIKLKISKSKLTLLASTPDAGSAVEDIDADYDNESMEIAFNSRYVLDIATQIEGKFMKFIMSDASSPVIIKEIDDDSAIYVLMPMRV